MKESPVELLKHTPKDYADGWKILRRRRAFMDKIEKGFDSTMHSSVGVWYPLFFTTVGLVGGLFPGLALAIGAHEVFPQLAPEVAADGIYAVSGMVGLLGLLGGMALSPQAKEGRRERYERQNASRRLWKVK